MSRDASEFAREALVALDRTQGALDHGAAPSPPKLIGPRTLELLGGPFDGHTKVAHRESSGFAVNTPDGRSHWYFNTQPDPFYRYTISTGGARKGDGNG